MKPTVLTNAFMRPSATRSTSGVTVSEDENVYACLQDIISAIHNEIDASPLMLPTSFDPEAVIDLLHHVDGIMLPGAVSNVHPSLYGQAEREKPQTFDKEHDTTDMFLVRQAQALGIPFFGICRSMQAMNVAFGGTLNQQLPEHGPIDHKCSYPCDGHDDSPTYMHDALVEKDGVLARYFPQGRIAINSMHEQAVMNLGAGLKIEARAPDGVIEAISLPDAPNFFIAVQWHPEAMPLHPVSQKLFEAFRADVQARFDSRFQAAPRQTLKPARWKTPELG